VNGEVTEVVEPLNDGSGLQVILQIGGPPASCLGVQLTNILGCEVRLRISIPSPVCEDVDHIRFLDLEADATGWGAAVLGELSLDGTKRLYRSNRMCLTEASLLGREIDIAFTVSEVVDGTVRRTATRTVRVIPYCSTLLDSWQFSGVYDMCVEECDDASGPEPICEDESRP
jgi:hypothetical protein